MKRLILLGGLLAFGLTAACDQVRADQLALTTVGNNIYQGYFVGPYTAQDGNQTLSVICDDFNTTVSQGWKWTASPVSFSDPNFLKDVKFGGVSTNLTGYSAMIDYFAAAYLAQQIMQNLNNPGAVDELSFALWGIFSTVARGEMDANSWSDYTGALIYASKHNSPSYYSNVEFWVPSPSGSSQEYITILATPEPSKWLLLLCGTLLLVAIKVKHLIV